MHWWFHFERGWLVTHEIFVGVKKPRGKSIDENGI
jgi:hypothetical protein